MEYEYTMGNFGHRIRLEPSCNLQELWLTLQMNIFTKMQGDKSKQNQKYHTCAWASSTVHVLVHVVFEDLPYVLVHFGSSGFCDILMLRLSSFLSPPSHSFLGFTSSACPRSCYMSALSSHPLTEYPLRGFKSPSEIRHLIWMRGEPAWITDPSIQQVEIIR